MSSAELLRAATESADAFPWWMWLPAPVVIAGIIWAFTTRPPAEPGSCPECGHNDGLDNKRKRCRNTDSHSGFGSDQCLCDNDFHWNVESTTVWAP